MVGRRHARASARSGPGHPPGRIRLRGGPSGRHQGALPEAVDAAPRPMTGGPTPSHRHGVSRHADAAAVRGAGAGIFREARPRGRSEARAELRRSSARASPPGRYQIVHGAADQCVALVEASKVDAIVVAGGDNGFNHLFVQPDIARIADLRGRTLVADVANTGWSFVLYDILKRHGLSRGDYHHPRGRRAVPPLRGDARRQDDGGGDPQSAVRHPRPARRAEGHGRRGRHHRALSRHRALCAARRGRTPMPDTLAAYLAACIEGLRWALDPANRAEAVRLTAERLERPGRHRGRNPRGGHRPGERPGQGRRFRPRRLQDRAEAPRRFRGPHRRRRRNNISICHSTGGPSPGFESGANQGIMGHGQKTSRDFQIGAGRGRRLADPGDPSGRGDSLHQGLQDQGRGR